MIAKLGLQSDASLLLAKYLIMTSLHLSGDEVADHEQSRSRIPTSTFDAVVPRPTVFDRKHALTQLAGMEDVLLDVMKLITTESAKVHAEISAAYGRRDAVSLRRSAHTLKGAASLVGAADLVNRLKLVEEFAVANEFDRAAGEFPEINRQFAELQSQVDSDLRSRA